MVGVTRDLSAAYRKLRGRGKFAGVDSSGAPVDVEMLDFGGGGGGGARPLELAHGPMWATVAEQIRLLMHDTEGKIHTLAQLHDKSLMAAFDLQEQEKAIEMMTAEITGYFRKCKKSIKELGDLRVDEQTMVVKANVQRELAARLQALTSDFRQRQKIFLNRLEKNNRTVSKYEIAQSGGAASAALDYAEEDLADPGFNDTQLRVLRDRQRLADTRSQEIEEIHRSIVELAEIFQEMAAIVVEQGTILDRIDYNIERTSHNVKQAVKELETGYKYQKSSRTKLILLVILLLIVGVMIAVMVRIALIVITP